jgi:uncharacterized protein
MFRLILWGLVIWLVLKYLVPALRRPVESQRPEPPPPDAGAQDTVRCARCGLFVLRSEAFSDGNHFYCSEEHRKAGPR